MDNINYSSIYDIKNFASQVLVPKYFDTDEVGMLNVGLIGYLTELVSTVTEDTFNTVTTMATEILPNTAILPRSIYSHAALFQLSDIFAKPAVMDLILFIAEEDIIENGSRVIDPWSGELTSEELFEFHLDSNMNIDVEGISFMPDFNIRINYRPYMNDYVYTAMYDMTKRNTISSITEPYVKTKRMLVSGKKYLALLVKTHQVSKEVHHEVITEYGGIDTPNINIPCEDGLCNFEVFYKDSLTGQTTQLKKLINGSIPIDEPFCYFRLKSDDILEIDFSTKDGYFKPRADSELDIEMYYSEGTNGEFKQYVGDDINIEIESDVYEYNNNLVLFGVPQSDSSMAEDKPTIEELRKIVVERYSTNGSYNTESDLDLYFSNFKSENKTQILFIKTRDDIFRLFTSFAILKDINNETIPSNTLHLTMQMNQFDVHHVQTDSYVIQPGKLFTYDGVSLDSIKAEGVGHQYHVLNIPDSLANKDFLYTNPFLIYITKDPATVGYYINSMDATYKVDYYHINPASFAQFLCNEISIKRNAIHGENEYVFTITISPTSELSRPIVELVEDEDTGEEVEVINNSVVPRMILKGSDGTNISFIDFRMTSHDLESETFTYEGRLKTDDFFTDDGLFRVLDTFRIGSTHTDTIIEPTKIIPMENTSLYIHLYYNGTDANVVQSTDVTKALNITGFTETNIFKVDNVTFIQPVDQIRSTMLYRYNNDGTIGANGEVINGTYSMYIKSFPVLKAQSLLDTKICSDILKQVVEQYKYADKITNNKTNNYSIDIKFFNTFGRSKNFVVESDTQGEFDLLDKNTITLNLQIKPTYGVDVESLVRDLKIFIKEYIENINSGTGNSLYISNLIKQIEIKFTGVKYMKFKGINQYKENVQVIESRTIDLHKLSKPERMNFVPEYLSIQLDNIIIDII
jgi:hypothetical protein